MVVGVFQNTAQVPVSKVQNPNPPWKDRSGLRRMLAATQLEADRTADPEPRSFIQQLANIDAGLWPFLRADQPTALTIIGSGAPRSSPEPSFIPDMKMKTLNYHLFQESSLAVPRSRHLLFHGDLDSSDWLPSARDTERRDAIGRF